MDFLTIAEFAEKAGVSKQAIYKQVRNEKSQIAPFTMKDGKRTLINSAALKELYRVDEKTTQESTFSTQTNPIKPENSTSFNPDSTSNSQPLSTQYAEFLMEQIAELKAERAETEQRLNAIIQEKDRVIANQSEQLAQLAQQVAEIANKALITTSQQQYLTAADRVEKQEQSEIESANNPKQPILKEAKKSIWKRLFK